MMDPLLLREEIVLDSAYIQKYILNKRVLITGAAGSIGCELLKQILPFDPALLIAIDQSEAGIHAIKSQYRHHSALHTILANIADPIQMQQIFQDFSPQVVFHTAAYKHVALLEKQPAVAIKNNTFGTQLLADLSNRSQVEKFIFISTDKAVNPIGVMGISKRLSELYLLWLSQQKPGTQFITARFGNILGSSGSVYHTFLNQIEKGIPLSVSHPKASRYFMSVFEAVQLVLESAAIGMGGQIMVFDMGEPIVILDLAHRMLSQYKLASSSQNSWNIQFTGLQPGEKLHEELLYPYEPILHHHQEKMKVVVPDFKQLPPIYQKIDLLHQSLNAAPTTLLPHLLRNIL